MNRIQVLKNPILNYIWGSRTVISELLGESTPSVKPEAELWMGAHPKASSMFNINGSWITLKEAISENAQEILGGYVIKGFNRALPFLFKLLAVEYPLSIQVHPNKVQAQHGFNKENRENIPLDSPVRNYRDANHKPELLCAVSPFWALCGFRKIHETISYFEKAGLPDLKSEIDRLKHCRNPLGMKDFFSQLMILGIEKRRKIITGALQWGNLEARNDPVAEWTTRLCREYPEDLGALAPLYLNLICLNPGEAVYLPPGVLHSYLRGTGIEIMANSDNVIRGGITTKHINIKELLEIVRFDEMDHNILNAVPTREYESSYLTPVREFSLSVINIKGEGEYISETNRSIEIILTIRGSGIIMAKDTTGIELNQGLSVMIPASVDEYRITGNLTAYKASVPNR